MLLFLLIVLILVSVYYVYKSYYRPGNYFITRGIDYYQKSFSQHLWQLFRGKISIYDETKYLYKKFSHKRWQPLINFNAPIWFIRDPEIIGLITIKHFENFIDHSDIFFRQEIIEKNLFSLKGKKWQDMRSTLSPAFTGAKLRGIFGLINECGKDVMKYFQEKLITNNNSIFAIDFKDVSIRFTSDIIATTAFGLKVDSFREPNNKFFKTGFVFSDISLLRVNLLNYFPNLCKFFNFALIPLSAVDYFCKIIFDTIETREQNNITRPDMLQLLIDAKNGRLNDTANNSNQIIKKKIEITKWDIAAQAFIFFLGGSETVSSTISFIIYELTINPDVQNKLYDEIKTVTDTGNELTYDIVKSMKYIDMVIKETMRKWPLASLIDRVCTKTFELKTNSGDILNIEKNVLVHIPTAGIHFDSQYFSNPHKFDPERFDPDNKTNIVANTYLPFGIGPRHCIGNRFALLEIKIFLIHFLSNFELVVIEKTEIPLQVKSDSLQMQPKNGLWIGLKPRK